MRFTLWSRESLLGEVDLGSRFSAPRILVGPFHPTDVGRGILPLFVEAQTAILAVGPMLERRGITSERCGEDLGQAVYEALQDSPEGMHVRNTRAALDALALMLRDATGRSISLEHITIHDAWSPQTAAASDETRARIEAAGFSQYLAAVVFADDPPHLEHLPDEG